MKVKYWLFGNLKWEIGSGTLVEIGLDPIKRFLENHSLPYPLIRIFHDKGIYFLHQIHIDVNSIFHYATQACSKDLGLFGELTEIWDMYVINYIWLVSH